MAVKMIVKANMYQDSVALMRISSQIRKLPGINQAAVVMGTPQNKNVLEESGLTAPELKSAKPSDLIVAFDADTEANGQQALTLLDKLLEGPNAPAASRSDGGEVVYTSIRTALEAHSDVNMIAISVPGEFAFAEALKALKSNTNVFLFSDNISVGDEVELKKYAWNKGLILMGPDCGTAYIDGVPFGFVNKVRRGNIGIVGSSGTGIQEIMTQIHRMGGGISHIIGTGGRDLSETVAGLSTRSALAALENDPGTETIILVSKPPAKAVADKILGAFSESGKKVIACLLGYKPEKEYDNIQFADTLQQAACLAAGYAVQDYSLDLDVSSLQGKAIRGLFSGGTLASEAYMMIKEELGDVYSNIAPSEEGKCTSSHIILDMGSDEFTRGKPHPIIDLTDRLEQFKKEASDNDVGVILMDLVLGYGAHPDPASELAPYIRQLCSQNGPMVVINLLGTDLDIQGYDAQAAKLREAGAIVVESNYHAVLAALKITGVRKEDGRNE